ncbi:uncharacterized protein [Physcomitrium patens]|uniref:Protein SirB1 N-terminal domain-containing protein n=1 Tax=Physcomitrium patens TaxID=3218 RepID=A9TY64_PHYPA|nr:uncharacterized protein LOC112274309 [Physcomitrium patens]XP_024359447.1 uncharacterized protein LOC112274309 [Physcomitrium patens]XP_024359448.1 uncharacterized protein LOC112274309 [Physcomitrium patens]XP_024359449.1 uncharacterized protein LOC112274309 [Physcomitrium patens]XP_024359450.1 uncharacterized protein LOC112274309 [Physcomitrium patens]XP_024359451.1 uncharacterized protein LOC112274309 [Physcomitrium patens]PNR31962.1 hypothetical protein PHYPA_026086 [Physcomitrium paten|eukprot:XP_024359446.1 uncharacterized protein LOC112274309 [Physcomitrella patens]
MEPACANLARSQFSVMPVSLSPCCSKSNVCNTRVSSAFLQQGNVTTRSSLLVTSTQAVQVGNYACCAQSCTHGVELNHGLGGRLVMHTDIGWHERLEVRDVHGHSARSKTSSTNVGCSRSLFDNLEGHWFRDQPRIGSTHSSAFGNSSPASTSGGIHRRGSPWGSKRPRSRNCCCSSEGMGGDKNETGAGGEEKYEVSRIPNEGVTNRATPSSKSDRVADRSAAQVGTLESELFLYTGRMRALENFRAEVAKPDEEISLVRAAVFVAQHLYPRITAEEVEAEMKEMADELEPLLPPPAERYTMRMINSINRYLYGQLGYKGATNYLDPDNSCINMVLKRREGLPLTMSLLYMELAKRVGLPMQGVNLPAHFMCRPTGDGLEFFIDAHANGKITFLQDAEERLSVVYGVPVEINPEFLKHTSITNRAFLLRLLFNLKRIYFERKDPVSTLCIIDYLKIVRPGVIEETRDYGICLYLLNRFSEAIPCLEAYIQEAPRATDAESMRSLLTKMRRDKMS